MIRSVTMAYAVEGQADFADGEYYDFFRSSQYWDTSVPEQARFREQLVKALKDADASITSFEKRLKN